MWPKNTCWTNNGDSVPLGIVLNSLLIVTWQNITVNCSNSTQIRDKPCVQKSNRSSTKHTKEPVESYHINVRASALKTRCFSSNVTPFSVILLKPELWGRLWSPGLHLSWEGLAGTSVQQIGVGGTVRTVSAPVKRRVLKMFIFDSNRAWSMCADSVDRKSTAQVCQREQGLRAFTYAILDCLF